MEPSLEMRGDITEEGILGRVRNSILESWHHPLFFVYFFRSPGFCAVKEVESNASTVRHLRKGVSREKEDG